jgi:hypothetical protein
VTALDRFFDLTGRGTNARTELRGAAAFLAYFWWGKA